MQTSLARHRFLILICGRIAIIQNKYLSRTVKLEKKLVSIYLHSIDGSNSGLIHLFLVLAAIFDVTLNSLVPHYFKHLTRWAAPSEFVTYRLCEQRRFRRACASAQSRQNLRCSLIQAVNQEEPSDRKPDPWPL